MSDDTMSPENQMAAALVAAYFSRGEKTQSELRRVIREMKPGFPDMTEEDVEIIAKHNEETQGVKWDLN